MDLYVSFGIFAALILLGLIAGQFNERRHFRNLARREQAVGGMIVTQLKTFPGAVSQTQAPTLLTGEVVIASDYLKSFLARLRKIFGGRLGSYQSLLIRARREALLRILEEAHRRGYNAICNVRLETADVGGNSGRRRVAMVALLASATAYLAAPPDG